MYDPNAGKLDVDAAEQVLGIEPETKQILQMDAALKLVMSKLEITEEDVERAYESSLLELIKSTHATINSVVVGGLDAL